MSTYSVDIPSALQARLEQLARDTGLSVSELLVDAADKMTQIELLEKTKATARLRDTRAGFERVLSKVPNAEPVHAGDVID